MLVERLYGQFSIQYLTKVSTALTCFKYFDIFFHGTTWSYDTLIHCKVVSVQLV